MALSIETITTTPSPVRAGEFVRVVCRIASDEPVKSVTAYAPDGETIPFQRDDDGAYSVSREVPPMAPAGTYDVTAVAYDTVGNVARKTFEVTIAG